jgi:hypothetical protein
LMMDSSCELVTPLPASHLIDSILASVFVCHDLWEQEPSSSVQEE